MTNRYCDPKHGCYTQVDPIVLSGGNPTLYGYVTDPNAMVDFFGLRRADHPDILGKNSSDFGNYTFKEGIDTDLRGKGNYKDAIDMGFENTGVSKEDFSPTKWGKDKNGKSFPAEWRSPNGGEVNVDLGHPLESGAPTVPHVGWQTPGKRGHGGGARGHIFVDDVPYNR